jgi:hypothetical protein
MGEQRLCFTPRLGPRAASHRSMWRSTCKASAICYSLHAFDLAFIESHPDQPAQQIYVKDPAGNQLEFLKPPTENPLQPVEPSP